MPVAEFADRVPLSVTLVGALAELLMLIEPPVPAPGASAVMLPLMPLLVTVPFTIKGLAASL